MKRQTLIRHGNSVAEISKSWETLIAKLPPFVGKCDINKDWGSIALTNMALRNEKVSVDLTPLSGMESIDVELKSKVNDKDILQIGQILITVPLSMLIPMSSMCISHSAKTIRNCKM